MTFQVKTLLQTSVRGKRNERHGQYLGEMNGRYTESNDNHGNLWHTICNLNNSLMYVFLSSSAEWRASKIASSIYLLWCYANCSDSWFLLRQELICTITDFSKHLIVTDVSATSWYSLRHGTLLFLGTSNIDAPFKAGGTLSLGLT